MDSKFEPPSSEVDPQSATVLRAAGVRTTARILTGRSGQSYRTATWLALREDHSAAIDAVWSEVDWKRGLGASLVDQWKLFEVQSQVRDKSEYILRPDLGRRLNDRARTEIASRCPISCDLQIVVGDGLSAAAITNQIPRLLPTLADAATRDGLRIGQTFFVRYCRVGIMNDIGELLQPTVVVLLIGERPGLATADSLSAYLAYRPQSGHTDAERNLISNIHSRGVLPESAAQRIVTLTRQLMRQKTSGFRIKEELQTVSIDPAAATLLNHVRKID